MIGMRCVVGLCAAISAGAMSGQEPLDCWPSGLVPEAWNTEYRMASRIRPESAGAAAVEFSRPLLSNPAFKVGVAQFNADMTGELSRLAGGGETRYDASFTMDEKDCCVPFVITGRFVELVCSKHSGPFDPEHSTRRNGARVIDLKTGTRITLAALGPAAVAESARRSGDCSDDPEAACTPPAGFADADLLLLDCGLVPFTGTWPAEDCADSWVAYRDLAPLVPEQSPLKGLMVMQAEKCGTHRRIAPWTEVYTAGVTVDGKAKSPTTLTLIRGSQWPEHVRAWNETRIAASQASFAKPSPDAYFPAPDPEAGPECWGETQESVLLTLDRFVTVERTGWDDCRGNAHPNHGSSLQNYDMRLGRGLEFDELFSDPVRARDVARAEIIETAKAEGHDDWFSEEGGSGEYRRWLEGGSYDFSIHEFGLTILTPNLYYADTQLEITVPWDKLLPLIKPDGPLGDYRAWMRHQILRYTIPGAPPAR